jgi:hypothetical protein
MPVAPWSGLSIVAASESPERSMSNTIRSESCPIDNAPCHVPTTADVSAGVWA